MSRTTSRSSSRALRATTLAAVFVAALAAPSADAVPRQELEGSSRWARIVRTIGALFGGLWDGYGGYVDPSGNNQDGGGG